MALITGNGFRQYTPEEWAARLEDHAASQSNDSRSHMRGIDAANAVGNYGGSSEQSDYFRDRDIAAQDQYGQRAGTDYMSSQLARGQQARLADYFAMQAMGQGGPSVAQLQLQAGLDQSTNNAMGIAASSRGNPAAAARAAIQAQGQMSAQTNQQAGMLRAQEQLDAGNLAMQAGQGLRQQDLTSYNQNQQGQQAFRAAINDQATAELQTKANLYSGTQAGVLSARTQRDVSKQQGEASMIGATAQAAGAVAGGAISSDKRLKKNVRDGDALAQAFMDSLDAKGYEYKGDNAPQLGIMAQDMEQTRAGRTAVRNTPSGKEVSVADATSRLLAAVANLNKRTKQLEGKKGAR